MNDLALMNSTARMGGLNSLPALGKARFSGITGSGVWLSIVCLLITASAVRSLRVNVSGLLVHPYLLLLLPLCLFVAPRRIIRFPWRVLVALVAFEFCYVLSIATGIVSFNDILKIGAAGLTVVTVALLVRTKADFRAAVIALCVAAALLSIQNIVSGGESFGLGSNVDGAKAIANKNAFSLYALPALLLAITLIMDGTVSKSFRIIGAACTMIIAIAIFSSGNRSGWLGAICIAIMVFGRRRRVRSTILMSMIALGVYYVVVHYTDTTILARRVIQTEDGYSGDVVRMDLVSQSLIIAMENPLLGVSPSGLPRELGRRMPRSSVTVHSLGDVKIVGSHNVILQIIGGSGVIAFGLFIYFGWQLWKRPHLVPLNLSAATNRAHNAHVSLRMMMVLWLVRGMFTDEVLYSPSFCIGLGLCIGLCMTEGLWRGTHTRAKSIKLDYPSYTPALHGDLRTQR